MSARRSPQRFVLFNCAPERRAMGFFMVASSSPRRSHSRVFAVVATALALVAPSTAAAAEEPETPAEASPPPAPPPRRFGGAGQVILGDLIGYRVGGPPLGGPIGIIGFGHNCQRDSLGSSVTSETCSDAFWLAPTVDVGIGHGLTLGGTLRVDYRHVSLEPMGAPSFSGQATGGSLSLTAIPRVGYVFDVNEDFAVWPRVGAGFYGLTGNNVQTWTGWTATAGVGLVFRAGRYVYVNATPELSYGRTTSTWEAPPGNTTMKAESAGFNFSASASLGIVLGS